MRNRWLLYTVIGLCFGIADWYFLDWLASLSLQLSLNENLLQAPDYARGLIVMAMITSNFGIWLVPVIPIAIYEMKHSHSLHQAAISAVTVWSAALLSYYVYYTFMLMFVGLPNMEFMLFSNRHSATYWDDWWSPFRRLILGQFIEWIGVAVVGGAIVGTLSAGAFRLMLKRKAQRASL